MNRQPTTEHFKLDGVLGRMAILLFLAVDCRRWTVDDLAELFDQALRAGSVASRADGALVGGFMGQPDIEVVLWQTSLKAIRPLNDGNLLGREDPLDVQPHR